MKKNENIIIFKNDRIGDLIPSVPAINLLINNNQDKKIIIYLSNINYKMKFLFEKKNVEVIKVKYSLSIMNRISILLFFMMNKISKVYIMRPKNFFFLLPFFFFYKKIQFFALCVNSNNNYRRPKNFFRKYLSNYVINDRETKKIRPSRKELQLNLVDRDWKKKLVEKEYDLEISDQLKKILPIEYCLIHYKKNVFEKLSWGRDGLLQIITHLNKYYSKIILINDIEGGSDNEFFKGIYDWFDFKTRNSSINNHNVIYLENIDGLDLFNVIKKAKKTIACHGTITLLGNLVNTPILDLFNCEINSNKDFYQYKNSFHEHVPKNNYDFIIPNKDIDKTLRKMKFSLIK